MSFCIVSLPIKPPKDLSFYVRKTLWSEDLIIGGKLTVLRQFLTSQKLTFKTKFLEILNKWILKRI